MKPGKIILYHKYSINDKLCMSLFCMHPNIACTITKHPVCRIIRFSYLWYFADHKTLYVALYISKMLFIYICHSRRIKLHLVSLIRNFQIFRGMWTSLWTLPQDLPIVRNEPECTDIRRVHLGKNFWKGILEQMTDWMNFGEKVEYYNYVFSFVLILILPRNEHKVKYIIIIFMLLSTDRVHFIVLGNDSA